MVLMSETIQNLSRQGRAQLTEVAHFESPTSSVESLISTYSISQEYQSYTAENHRTWQLATTELEQALVGHTAVDYRAAFKETGMSVDHVPSLKNINEALARFGWQAIVVEGFIPPDVFMTLQANKVLPITRSIRSESQLGYTPVPDILHEAAGHLPMLYHEEYRRFLQRLGEIGARVHLTELDMQLYEKQKALAEHEASDQVRPEQLELMRAEIRAAVALANSRPTSTARRIARFHWWTVEYGLIGPDHLIYGAGLLSSVHEVKRFRDAPHVRLSVDCCEQSFDIDDVQPLYYVADSWQHLHEVLDALSVEVVN